MARHVRVTLESFGHMLVKRFVTSEMPVTRFVKIVIVTLVRHLSTAVGISNTQSVPHSTSLFARQTRFGGSVSTIVTVWLQKALLVHASVARHVRVTLKSLGHMLMKVFVTSVTPAALVTSVIITLLLQTSTAVGISNTQSLPHCTSLSGPQ